MTIIDRADNGESYMDKGTELRPGIAYNERNSQFVRVSRFLQDILKIMANHYSNSWFH